MKRTRMMGSASGSDAEDLVMRKRRSTMKSLNDSFVSHLSKSMAQDDGLNYSLAMLDYLDQTKSISTTYTTDSGSVFSFGSGDCGQLAHGAEEDDDLMVKYPRIIASLYSKSVKAISCGGLHNAIVTTDGQIFTWGCADDGSLGRIGDENTPLLVTGNNDELLQETFVSVACGDGQTIGVTLKGNLYGWGCYKDKEGKSWFNPEHTIDEPWKHIKKKQGNPVLITNCGPRPKSSQISKHLKWDHTSPVTTIACGSSFNIVTCADGSVLSFGSGECGELGRICQPMRDSVTDEYDNQTILVEMLTPGLMYKTHPQTKKREIMKNAKSVGCGSYHAMVVDTGGGLYTCGLNNYGQLGHNDLESRDTLTFVEALRDIPIQLAKGGMHHSLLLTCPCGPGDNTQGNLIGIGRADSGQLGIPSLADLDAGSCAIYPVVPLCKGKTDIQPIFTDIDCGTNHNLALSSTGDVYSWGYGDMLALGHGKEADEKQPRKIDMKKAIDERGRRTNNTYSVFAISAGGQHSALLGK